MRTTPIMLTMLMTFAGLARDVPAQGRRADYERARKLRSPTQDRVFRDRVEPHWLPGNSRFWYRVPIGEGRHRFVLVRENRG
jgi:hypothetical protein